MKRLLALALLSFAAITMADPAMVYFISPANNAVVSNPVTLQFGLKGMGIAPAGSESTNPAHKTGHHHLLIDTPLPTDMTLPIAMDEKHRHFGGGQTETSLQLTPGKHTLQLLQADKNHIPHVPAVYSPVLTIIVK